MQTFGKPKALYIDPNPTYPQLYVLQMSIQVSDDETKPVLSPSNEQLT